MSCSPHAKSAGNQVLGVLWQKYSVSGSAITGRAQPFVWLHVAEIGVFTISATNAADFTAEYVENASAQTEANIGE
jgi:hypothetical protein